MTAPTPCGTPPATVDREELFGYLGPYRLARADAVLVIGDAPDILGRLAVPAAACDLAPWTTVPVAGRRVAVFATSTSPATAAGLRAQGAEEVAICGDLADRAALRAALAAPGADLFLTEIKAAGIDVVAEEADRRGIELGFLDNRPVGVDDFLAGLIRQALADAEP